MTVHRAPGPHLATPPPTVPAWRSFMEWMLTLLGAVAVFMGAFILLGGDEHAIGFFDSSWEIGEISPWWGIGLLVGGTIALMITLGSVVQRKR